MNTISLSRLKNLFIEYIILNWKKHSIVFGIFFSINVLYGSFGEPYLNYGVIMLMMIILLSRLFKFVENQHQKISYFLIPASIEEKFIANILISHFYFVLLFIVSIISGYNAGILIYDFYHHSAPVSYEVALFNYRIILFMLGVQSVFMFGKVLFKKKGILITLLCLVIFFVIGNIIAYMLLVTLDLIRIDNVEDYVYVLEKLIDSPLDDSIFHIFNYLVIFFFWTLSYFRLKRMEV